MFFEDQTIEDIQRSEKPRIRASRSRNPQEQHDNTEERTERNDADTGEGAMHDQNDQEMDEEEHPNQEEDSSTQSETRRSTRDRRPSTRYSQDEYVTLTDEGEPQSYKEAIVDTHKTEWVKAMQDEMQSLHENHTYELVELPKGRRALKNKWVFRIKSEEGNSKPRYKARLVVKGFSQKKGVDFEEIFSPVVKMFSIRVVLGLATVLDLEIEQLDVKTAFLHGDLEEEIYMEQPEGFRVPGKENLVCRLKKSLYGLKQAPRQWYKKFDSFMADHNFKKTMNDHCIFMKRSQAATFSCSCSMSMIC